MTLKGKQMEAGNLKSAIHERHVASFLQKYPLLKLGVSEASVAVPRDILQGAQHLFFGPRTMMELAQRSPKVSEVQWYLESRLTRGVLNLGVNNMVVDTVVAIRGYRRATYIARLVSFDRREWKAKVQYFNKIGNSTVNFQLTDINHLTEVELGTIICNNLEMEVVWNESSSERGELTWIWNVVTPVKAIKALDDEESQCPIYTPLSKHYGVNVADSIENVEDQFWSKLTPLVSSIQHVLSQSTTNDGRYD